MLPYDSDFWETIKSDIHDRFYTDLLSSIECGAFDGGCVVVAQAIAAVFGGALVCLTTECDRAQHAAVLRLGFLWDYDGPLPFRPFINRFVVAEQPPFPIVSFRHLTSRDLPAAPRNTALVKRCSSLLSNSFRHHIQLRGHFDY